MTEPKPARSASPAPGPEVRWYAVVLAVGQVGLVVLAACSLWQIAGGWWLGAVAAVPAVLALVVLYQVWLAPGSRRRLRYKERLTITLVLGSLICVASALANLLLPSLVALSVAVLGDALDAHRPAR